MDIAEKKSKQEDLLKSSVLLRRFTILFFAFAVTPLIVLFYIFGQYQGESTIVLDKEQLTWFILGIAVVCLLGFLGLRNSLKKVVILSGSLKRALFDKVDEQLITNLAKGEGEVANLAKVFGDVFKKLEGNIKELEETKKKLHEVLYKVSKALSSTDNFALLIQLILETAVDALLVKKGVVFSYDESGLTILKASCGFVDISQEQILDAAASSIDWVAKEKKVLTIPSLIKETATEKNIFTAPVVYMPLVFRDKLWGILCLSGKEGEGNFTEDELKMISNLSYQMAISFENITLNKDIERNQFETIAALALAVEAKDPYSRGHSERVGAYAVKIGAGIGLPEQDLKALRDACRLHDLGKIGVADKILKKKGGLSSEERDIMLRHPHIGESIVKPLKTFQHLLSPIRHHHEFLDGTGYPDGLKGDQIPLITRILTVADIFDALTSTRPYRKALTIEEAKTELYKFVDGGKIDVKVVAVLFQMVEAGEIKPEPIIDAE